MFENPVRCPKCGFGPLYKYTNEYTNGFKRGRIYCGTCRRLIKNHKEAEDEIKINI